MNGIGGKPTNTMERNPLDAAKKDCAPDDPEQDSVPLDGWDQPKYGNAEAKPNTAEESKVAVQEGKGRKPC